MEKINFGYSLKNIPIPSGKQYLKCFIDKLNSFIRRVRWKVFFYENDDEDPYDVNKSDTFGFASDRFPPQNEALRPFEMDLYELARSITFKPTTNTFQKNLQKDIQSIKLSNKMFVAADKTTNIYEMDVDNYRKLLRDNITSTYKKADKSLTKKINQEAKHIAEKLKLDNRIECLAEKNSYITLKDHKDNFYNNPQCRLINPTKLQIGIISKNILDKINTRIRSSTGLQQWRNTKSVLSWFKNITNKKSCKFLKFDIIQFYPSITEKLFRSSINFAKRFINIEDYEIKVILHCRKSILFSDDSTWIKKTIANST